MNVDAPIFQFEIRFTPILNISSVLTEAVSPFIVLASNIHVANENTKDARYTLEFHKQYHRIIIGWDRIVIRIEDNIDNIDESNSILETPFFSLFEKMEAMPHFGQVNELMLYSIVTKETEGDSFESIMSKFAKPALKELLPTANDIALNLECKEDGDFTSIIHGPYMGLEDLNKRNAIPNYREFTKYDYTGEMAEIKIFRKNNTADFKEFKESYKLFVSFIDKLWQH